MRTFMQFLNEISREQLALAGERINKFVRKEFEGEPFNDIFGDKSRIIIPFLDEEEKEFIDFLAQHGLMNPNFKDGTGEASVETKFGVKKRVMKIGKFLQQLAGNKPEVANDAQDYLAYWEKNKVKLEKPEAERKGVSIIITRHPLDLIRMSDHRELESCHSPDGSYFKCAVQEAKTGGALALVVRNEELRKIKNLQAKNIFQDKDRRIEGMEPIERLRLRRFSDDETDYLVPTSKSYGRGHAGLYDSVRAWALAAQAEKLKTADYNSLELRGGSYMDAGDKAPDIWKKFTGQDVTMYKSSADQNDEQDKGRYAGWEDEVNRIQERANQELEHFSLWGSVEDMGDGEMYVSMDGGVEFDFSDLDFIKPLPGYKEGVNNWQEKRKLQDEIRKHTDLYGIEELEVEDDTKLRLMIRPDDQEATPEGFDNFFDTLNGWDDDYKEIKARIQAILRDMGYIHNPLHNLDLVNFDSDSETTRDGDWEVNFNSNSPERIGTLAGLPKEQIMIDQQGNLHDVSEGSTYSSIQLGEKLKPAIEAYIKRRLSDPEAAFTLSTYLKATSPDQLPKGKYGDDHFAQSRPLEGHPDNPVAFSMDFGFTNPSEREWNAAQMIDEMWEDIAEYAGQWWGEKRQQYTLATQDGQEDSHPGVRATAKRIEAAFGKFGQNGKVNVTRGQDGSLVYWYTDPQAGISAPASQAWQVFSAHAKEAQTVARDIQYGLRLYQGMLQIKYQQGRPTLWWHTYGEGSRMGTDEPVEQAIARKVKDEENRHAATQRLGWRDSVEDVQREARRLLSMVRKFGMNSPTF